MSGQQATQAALEQHRDGTCRCAYLPRNHDCGEPGADQHCSHGTVTVSGTDERPCETCADYGQLTPTVESCAWTVDGDERIPGEPYPCCPACSAEVMQHPVRKAEARQ